MLTREKSRMERGPTNSDILEVGVMGGRNSFLIFRWDEGCRPIFLASFMQSSTYRPVLNILIEMQSSVRHQVCQRRATWAAFDIILANLLNVYRSLLVHLEVVGCSSHEWGRGDQLSDEDMKDDIILIFLLVRESMELIWCWGCRGIWKSSGHGCQHQDGITGSCTSYFSQQFHPDTPSPAPWILCGPLWWCSPGGGTHLGFGWVSQQKNDLASRSWRKANVEEVKGLPGWLEVGAESFNLSCGLAKK